MTNDEQYVPDEQDLEVAWIESEASADDINVASAEFDRFLAHVRRDAQREAYTTARSVLAGEDTVEWARGAHGSSMSYPHAIGIMDDLIEDLDEEVSP